MGRIYILSHQIQSKGVEDLREHNLPRYKKEKAGNQEQEVRKEWKVPAIRAAIRWDGLSRTVVHYGSEAERFGHAIKGKER